MPSKSANPYVFLFTLYYLIKLNKYMLFKLYEPLAYRNSSSDYVIPNPPRALPVPGAFTFSRYLHIITSSLRLLKSNPCPFKGGKKMKKMLTTILLTKGPTLKESKFTATFPAFIGINLQV